MEVLCSQNAPRQGGRNMERNKYWRRLKAAAKLKRLYYATKSAYGAGAYFDKKKKRIRKYSCNSASLRRSLNRSLRRKMSERQGWMLHERLAPGTYRKMKDYWWELM